MDNFNLKKFITEGKLLKESTSLSKTRNHNPGHAFVQEWLKSSKADPNDIGWEDKINTRDIGGYEGYNDDVDAVKSLIRDVESQGGEAELWLEPYEVKLETYGDHETLRVEIIDGNEEFNPIEEGDSRDGGQEEEHLLKWMKGLANEFDNDNNYFEVDSLDNGMHGDGTDIVHDFIVYLSHEYESSGTTPIDLDTYDVDQFFSTFTEKDYSSDFVNENSEEQDEYNDVIEYEWAYISINSEGDVDVPCTVTLDYGTEPYHVRLPAGELEQYGIDVEGKEAVELTDDETEAILGMVEAKIQAKY